MEAKSWVYLGRDCSNDTLDGLTGVRRKKVRALYIRDGNAAQSLRQGCNINMSWPDDANYMSRGALQHKPVKSHFR